MNWPFLRDGGASLGTQLIEPIVQVIGGAECAAATGGQPHPKRG